MSEPLKTEKEVFIYILEKVLPDMDDVDYDPGDVIMRVRDMCYTGLDIVNRKKIPTPTKKVK